MQNTEIINIYVPAINRTVRAEQGNATMIYINIEDNFAAQLKQLLTSYLPSCYKDLKPFLALMFFSDMRHVLWQFKDSTVLKVDMGGPRFNTLLNSLYKKIPLYNFFDELIVQQK